MNRGYRPVTGRTSGGCCIFLTTAVPRAPPGTLDVADAIRRRAGRTLVACLLQFRLFRHQCSETGVAPRPHTLNKVCMPKLSTRRSPLMEVMDTMMIVVLDHLCFLVGEVPVLIRVPGVDVQPTLEGRLILDIHLLAALKLWRHGQNAGSPASVVMSLHQKTSKRGRSVLFWCECHELTYS